MGRKETQEKDVWKSSTTEDGEQSAMTVSMTLKQRSLATDSASGMLYAAKKCISMHYVSRVEKFRDFLAL